MDSSVMPLQLLHSDRFPFFQSLMIVPLPCVGYHFIVLNVLEDLLKKLWHFFFFCFQHLCIHIVVPWCFALLLLHDCIFDFLDSDGPKFDAQVLFCLTNVCQCWWVTPVEELLKVSSPSL